MNMQNISVMSLGTVSNAKASGNQEKNSDLSDNFQKCMDNTQKDSETVKPIEATKETKVSSSSKTVESVEEISVSDTTSNSMNVESETIPQKITNVEEQIQDIVETVLELDDEQIEEILAEMGISLCQILDPSILQQFVITVNEGEDVTDFLTSEVMLEDFTNVAQALETIDWEGLTGLEEKEFLSFVKEFLDQPEQMMPELTPEQTDIRMDIPMESEPVQNILNDALTLNTLSKDTKMVANEETNSYAAKDAKGTQTIIQQEETIVSGNEMENTTANNSTTEQDLSQSQSQSGAQGRAVQENQTAATSQPVTVMNFVENLMQSAPTQEAAPPAQMQQMIDIVHQVVEQINTNVHEDTTTMEMQLNPENLGKVFLSISSKNGLMTANFTVQTEEAKEALESQMATLRENLALKNLKVESVDVSVSDFAFSQNTDTGDQKNFQQGNGKRAHFSFDEEEENDAISPEMEAEQVRRSVMKDSGSSVDYTA